MNTGAGTLNECFRFGSVPGIEPQGKRSILTNVEVIVVIAWKITTEDHRSTTSRDNRHFDLIGKVGKMGILSTTSMICMTVCGDNIVCSCGECARTEARWCHIPVVAPAIITQWIVQD